MARNIYHVQSNQETFSHLLGTEIIKNQPISGLITSKSCGYNVTNECVGSCLMSDELSVISCSLAS